MTTRSLLNAAVKGRFILSSTTALYGNPEPVPEHVRTQQLSPYGSSKLMIESMLHDVASARGTSYVVLRYFNVAGADPQGRIGLATLGARHICSRWRSKPRPASAPRSSGTDYPTPDGSCIRLVHVSGLAHAALSYLRGGGASISQTAAMATAIPCSKPSRRCPRL